MTLSAYPKYERYKDSGIDWIGKVPCSWDVQQGRQCLYEKKIKNIGMLENTVLSLSYGKVIVRSEDKLTGLVPESFETYQLVESGDIIIRGTDLQNDMTSLRTGLAYNRGIITSAYLNLRPKEHVSPQFMHFLLHSYDVQKVFYNLGSGLRQNLSYKDFKYLLFPLPSLPEQQSIAAFLDQKCAKIDEAVRIKEEQIRLLQERKQILIQQAVTKGLNPDVPMKDSGVEWIGEIPEHWEIKALKHGLRIYNGQDYKHVVSEQGYPVYGSGGVFAYASQYLYDGEAILLGRKGTIDKPLYVNGKFWTVDTMFYAVCKTKLLPKFAYYFCSTIPFFYLSTATALPSMTQEALNNTSALFPPISEQVSIVQFIEAENNRIDSAINIKQQQIAALKEYKTTLIDSAVTGKIKVC